MFLAELFGALEAARVAYAVVGGVAVNLHGVPRMTYDVDLADLVHLERLAGARGS